MDFSIRQLDLDFVVEKLTMSPFLQSVMEPAIGSVVYCDLDGIAEHSGIYVGNGWIMQLNRHGTVERVSPESFTTRASHPAIYVSCKDHVAVGDPAAARQAIAWEKAWAKSGHPDGYNLFTNNCHRFSSACLIGETTLKDVALTSLRSTAEQAIGANRWRAWWRGPGSLGNEERGAWAECQRVVESFARLLTVTELLK